MYQWIVTLQDRRSGRTTDVTFEARWDPTKVDRDSVGKAAAIQHGREMKSDYVCIAVGEPVRIEPVLV